MKEQSSPTVALSGVLDRSGGGPSTPLQGKGARLNLTEGGGSGGGGSGGRLSALRNWLKQTRWRRKERQGEPTGSPQHLAAASPSGKGKRADLSAAEKVSGL